MSGLDLRTSCQGHCCRRCNRRRGLLAICRRKSRRDGRSPGTPPSAADVSASFRTGTCSSHRHLCPRRLYRRPRLHCATGELRAATRIRGSSRRRTATWRDCRPNQPPTRRRAVDARPERRDAKVPSTQGSEDEADAAFSRAVHRVPSEAAAEASTRPKQQLLLLEFARASLRAQLLPASWRCERDARLRQALVDRRPPGAARTQRRLVDALQDRRTGRRPQAVLPDHRLRQRPGVAWGRVTRRSPCAGLAPRSIASRIGPAHRSKAPTPRIPPDATATVRRRSWEATRSVPSDLKRRCYRVQAWPPY